LQQTVNFGSKSEFVIAAARHAAGVQKVDRKRRLLADFVIGAHALLRADRLVTFNGADFRSDFPELKIFPARRTQ
jgi:predicted nucleic acid-binding protein